MLYNRLLLRYNVPTITGDHEARSYCYFSFFYDAVWASSRVKYTQMAGKIIIDIERCKGCTLCVTVCPNNVITISEKSNSKGYFPAESTGPDCTGCTNCAIVCPDCAIEVYRDKAGSEKIDIKSVRSTRLGEDNSIANKSIEVPSRSRGKKTK
jgi:2-oxoglutarate ferredoxin oxidoreductase subunit delta